MASFADLGARQKRLVTQLQAVTFQDSRANAIAMLNAYGWDVQRAADAFFSGDWEVEGSQGSAAAVPVIDQAKANAWFKKYADAEQPDTMQAEGIAAFCDDLQVSPEDTLLLVISFHFGAAHMLVYTKDEFLQGMANMGVDSIEGLRAAIPALRQQLEDADEFKRIYQFTFKWACPPGQKSMPVETAVALWRLLLEGRFALLDAWCTYVETNRKHAISRDEWNLLLDFSSTVDADLNGYDENSAWPVVIDTFAEHIESQRK